MGAANDVFSGMLMLKAAPTASLTGVKLRTLTTGSFSILYESSKYGIMKDLMKTAF